MTETPTMFSSCTAWFSKSCSRSSKEIWVQHGGSLEKDVSLAQFVFSDDWECPDTHSLLTSEQYCRQHLAVFHSRYVTKAAAKGRDRVVLGKYFLIPNVIKKDVNISDSSFARGKYYQEAAQTLERDALWPERGSIYHSPTAQSVEKARDEEVEFDNSGNSRGPEKKKATDLIPSHVHISPIDAVTPIKRKRKHVYDF